MKVGFYRDDLIDAGESYDPDDPIVIEEVAKDFADENHQIDEASDMNFTVYVEDDGGSIHEVKCYTEYDPRFGVESARKL